MSADTPSLVGPVDLAILDDDPDFCNYLEDALKDDGLYSIRTFVHPEELFAGCEQRLPDIVLLDMKMGEFKGDKVLEQLQTTYPGLCVIIVTGYPSLEDMRATFKMKVFDYISKPFSLAQLRQTLQNAIEKFGLGRTRARSPARAAGPSNQDAARGARLVFERSCRGYQAEHFADQFHRAWRESAEHRESAGYLPGVR